ncbi:protein CHAPERONE-LIKE PROTEIN OF POR1, chloroplastic [Silene latifolia]|uniref:protein CHAPERONE-LIKE PROTEIN OF POR1, chloroplastic n=1 Tax=Silene latifolia TaxID=37657 RepID=UPI003D777E74
MSVTGVAGTLSAYSIHLPTRESRLSNARVSACSMVRMPRSGNFLGVQRNSLAQGVRKQCRRRINMISCAMDASFGDAMNNQFDVFPRINIKDPYKRLGISSEASEEEINAARNFLLQRYAGHQPSVDAIEAAHNKIIMQQFHERRRPKLHIKKKVRDVTQSRYVQAVMNRFRTPADTKLIVKTAIVFLVLGVLTVLFPTEEGPTLQVAISLVATIYFVHSRLNSKLRAFLYGAGAFIFSWLVGTFLMVSIIPPIPLVKGFRSFEVMTSLITYVLLWVASTYLK